jgi:hypothetical protein
MKGGSFFEKFNIILHHYAFVFVCMRSYSPTQTIQMAQWAGVGIACCLQSQQHDLILGMATVEGFCPVRCVQKFKAVVLIDVHCFPLFMFL